jgi:hypothetical protein
MIADHEIALLLNGHGPIQATIVSLTTELADAKIMGGWWNDPELDADQIVGEIDRTWNWNAVQVHYPDDHLLQVEKVAVITGRGDETVVQGAMIISSDSIESIAQPGRQCHLVEFLFTAPRNRPHVRTDKQQWVIGVGTQLLIWAASFSRERGSDGRLRLDASPDFVKWYERKGLQKLKIDPIVYEDITYTPMELSAKKAQELLSAWDE